MTKSTTTLLKLFQWLLINLLVTMAGLRSLPFRQMPVKHSLCSATEGKGEHLPTWQACAVLPALGRSPSASGRRACQGLAAGWAGQADTGLKWALPAPGRRNWVGTKRVSISLCQARRFL